MPFSVSRQRLLNPLRHPVEKQNSFQLLDAMIDLEGRPLQDPTFLSCSRIPPRKFNQRNPERGAAYIQGEKGTALVSARKLVVVRREHTQRVILHALQKLLPQPL